MAPSGWGTQPETPPYKESLQTLAYSPETLYIKELEKQHTKPKVSRREELIKIGAEINELENRKTIEKMKKTKSWFFEKIGKIDKSLSRLTKKKRERSQ